MAEADRGPPRYDGNGRRRYLWMEPVPDSSSSVMAATVSLLAARLLSSAFHRTPGVIWPIRYCLHCPLSTAHGREAIADGRRASHCLCPLCVFLSEPGDPTCVWTGPRFNEAAFSIKKETFRWDLNFSLIILEWRRKRDTKAKKRDGR